MIPKSDCDVPGKTITKLELDLTERCPLACPYCYRFQGDQERKTGGESMSWEVAQRAVDWLIEVSGDAKQVGCWFLGGEPLMEFRLIKRFTEYAEQAAEKAGKRVSIGMTTNLVMINDDVMDFFRAHKMKFNTSIDGAPATQDTWRIFPDGSGTSHIVEPKIGPILDYMPNTTARSTVSPEGVANMFDNVKYLVALGYVHLAMMPVMESDWTDDQYATYADELRKVADLYVSHYRRGRPFYFKQLNGALKSIAHPRRRSTPCGAGRGLVCVGREGEVWPCHRFPGYDPDGASVLGDIWNGVDDDKRRPYLDLDCLYDVTPSARSGVTNCEDCLAVHVCASSCIAASYHLWRDISRPAPVHCRTQQIAFREAMRVHYILTKEDNKTFLKKFYGNGKAKGQKTPKPQRRSRRLPSLSCGSV